MVLQTQCTSKQLHSPHTNIKHQLKYPFRILLTAALQRSAITTFLRKRKYIHTMTANGEWLNKYIDSNDCIFCYFLCSNKMLQTMQETKN